MAEPQTLEMRERCANLGATHTWSNTESHGTGKDQAKRDGGAVLRTRWKEAGAEGRVVSRKPEPTRCRPPDNMHMPCTLRHVATSASL